MTYPGGRQGALSCCQSIRVVIIRPDPQHLLEGAIVRHLNRLFFPDALSGRIVSPGVV